MSKKAYFIGIAGKTTSSLAKALKDDGWIVSGSDQAEIYPPVSIYLKQNHIDYFRGYSPSNVPRDCDLIVVGRSALLVDSKNPEYRQAKKVGCPVLSYPEVLRDFLIKKNSIVVAGTYGKTTISALLAWILIQAGQDPSYMVGGIPVNMADGTRITDSSYSVVEGDEPPALKQSDPPKFMFYKPKYLLLTATVWDHPEIFKTEGDYEKAFEKLVNLVPEDGLIVYNQEFVATKVLQNAASKKISYSLERKVADYFVDEYRIKGEKSELKIDGKMRLALETSLIGKHNFENLCAAVALSCEIGIDEDSIRKAVLSFKGIRTRLEFLGEVNGRKFYWDLAQHPAKVGGSLKALRLHFPKSRIICVFDPAMTGLKYRQSLDWYQSFFAEADFVIVWKVGFISDVPRNQRVSGAEIVKQISRSQKNAVYVPLREKLLDWFTKETLSGDIVIFMSSGGLEFINLIDDILNIFRK